MKSPPRVYFFCRDNPQAYQDDVVVLADGLRQLGAEVLGSCNYWRTSPAPDSWLVRHDPAIGPAHCDIVVVSYGWSRWIDAGFKVHEQPLPENLFASGRRYRTAYLDLDDGYETVSWRPEFRAFDAVFRAKYNRRCYHPANHRPWALGLNHRMLEMTAGAPSWAQRRRELLVNFGASHPYVHSARALASPPLIAAARPYFAINEQRDNLQEPPVDAYDHLMWQQTQHRHSRSYYESAPANLTGANRMDAAQASVRITKHGGWRDRVAWIIAGVSGLALLAGGAAYFKRSATESHAVRLAFVPPENLVFDNGPGDSVVVSPDGQKLVFTGRSADGRRQLWARPLDSMEAQPLPGTDDCGRPFWSPDSRSIGFSSRGELKRIDLAGGRPQTLYRAPNSQGGTWSRSGVILFGPNFGSGLFRIPATGGEAQQVTSLDPALKEGRHRDPYFLPDGRHFLYRVIGVDGGQSIFVGSLDSKEKKQVLTDSAAAAYAPPGWLLFVRDGALLAQSFDAERLELKGDPFPLTRPSDTASAGSVPFSVSENGVLIWQSDRRREYQLVWFDREGKQGGAAGPLIKAAQRQFPRLSPDGKRVVVTRNDPQTDNLDIWMIDLQRNLPIRLTSDPANDGIAIWSPDGSRVIFQTNRGGANSIYQKVVSGAEGEGPFLKREGVHPTDWSADGRFIIYSTIAEKTRRDVWALPLFGDRQPYPLLNTAFNEYQAQFSPTIAHLAWVSDESGNLEVYVQPFMAEGRLGGAKEIISTGGGNQPRFRRDGRELFYVAADGQMMVVAVKTSGATVEFETPKALFKTRMVMGRLQSGTDYDVTADGQRFLIGTLVGESPPVSVILNWTADVRR